MTIEEATMSELKPCPFCEGGAEIRNIKGKAGHAVCCRNCKCGIGWFRTRKQAIDAWNQRADGNQELAGRKMEAKEAIELLEKQIQEVKMAVALQRIIDRNTLAIEALQNLVNDGGAE